MFFQQVHEIVRQIPKGRVTSYGAIAEYLGAKQAARMVGWAMNAAHGDETIPAHRVVNKAGILTGKHHFGMNPMQKLLEAEGIQIENNTIIHLEKHFWNPTQEILKSKS